MCSECFQIEYKNFVTEQEWLDFDWELVKKLGSNKMQHLSDTAGEYFYQCLNCNEKWKLRDPDYGYRGYFLKV